jgi:hypothetical protein
MIEDLKGNFRRASLEVPLADPGARRNTLRRNTIIESRYGHRLRDDYAPTGFKGYGLEKRAVKGHEFGLKLPGDEKAALIWFLKTL